MLLKVKSFGENLDKDGFSLSVKYFKFLFAWEKPCLHFHKHFKFEVPLKISYKKCETYTKVEKMV